MSTLARAVPLTAALALLVLALAGPATAGSARYVAGGGATAVCLTPGSQLLCGGGATFPVPDGADSARIEVRDLLTHRTPATYVWRDAADERMGSGSFCSETTAVVPSSAAERLDVFVPALPGADPCPAFSDVGTTGTVEIVWK